MNTLSQYELVLHDLYFVAVVGFFGQLGFSVQRLISYEVLGCFLWGT